MISTSKIRRKIRLFMNVDGKKQFLKKKTTHVRWIQYNCEVSTWNHQEMLEAMNIHPMLYAARMREKNSIELLRHWIFSDESKFKSSVTKKCRYENQSSQIEEYCSETRTFVYCLKGHDHKFYHIIPAQQNLKASTNFNFVTLWPTFL